MLRAGRIALEELIWGLILITHVSGALCFRILKERNVYGTGYLLITDLPTSKMYFVLAL